MWWHLGWLLVIIILIAVAYVLATSGVRRTKATLETKKRLLDGDKNENTWELRTDDRGDVTFDSKMSTQQRGNNPRNVMSIESFSNIIKRALIQPTAGETVVDGKLYLYAASRDAHSGITTILMELYDATNASPWMI